ncbi:uncharacterized protein BT62DRAFT_905989 [Guyanagaster necrorhizus]|uniref:RING-type E3 ubiquitin transferase n=1 Tax=Guyanagaster necrorhizus TaxID=856835 RepID=A0A9P7VKQ2_9AGAR|nr:uncharacterized protein BT62DRAFT_905989 [Guyanagaster necrorhizus MCA 3950]KAG7442494.1 hypothetical protein BT62DRAFT_905989 [Guyanagaster necrorhizus MCA 3950]
MREEIGDDAVCWICAEPVKYYSVSQCNHRTCHVCALRLRALYKKNDCTFCKEPQSSVIFTTSEDAPFLSFTDESTPYADTPLSILFETEEMMQESLILLRSNCPEGDCDFIAKGWADLKLHVRATHNKLMCDLCLRSKKVFAHEHALYTYPQLAAHLPSMNCRAKAPPNQIEGGVHPLCQFCRECFFDDDELFPHMRERHEECFICKRNGIRDQYFQNYETLESHFNNAHHPCMQSACLAQKFVVFNTPLDLKAHMVEEHGADMSSRDKKDARRVPAEFEFEDTPGRRGGGRRDREHERDSSVPGPSRPPGGGRRREGFGASLTSGNGSNTSLPTPPVVSRRSSPSPNREPVDPAVLEKHTAFLSRLQSFAPNPTTAIPAVKAAIRGYRASESSAKDLISTIWTVLDCHLEYTASIVNGFVDLLEEDEKKQDVLRSWKGFEIEQRRQFPDLVPSSVGNEYAGITSGRVLNAKHSTGSRSSQQSSRQVLDRVARTALSSTAVSAPAAVAKFPPLSSQSVSSSSSAFRQTQHKTPWSPSSAPGSRGPTLISRPPPGLSSTKASRPPPPELNEATFPGLPSAAPRAIPPMGGNTSLRNILGASTPPPQTVWNATSSSSVLDPTPEGSAPKGKKNKGKQKQALFTLGTFPTRLSFS